MGDLLINLLTHPTTQPDIKERTRDRAGLNDDVFEGDAAKIKALGILTTNNRQPFGKDPCLEGLVADTWNLFCKQTGAR